MKICLISKYPPIEGGESAKAYWMARGLGRKGHQVHIITNAWEVEERYRERLRGEDLEQNYQPQGVCVHNTNPFVSPGYIPYSNPYTEKLASLAIEMIRDFELQIIDSWYILPYVVSGFIAKTITGKPQIMRHAGSDMTRLLNSSYLNTLFVSLFKEVDRVITYPIMGRVFQELGVPEERLFYNQNVSLDTTAFHPSVEPIDLNEYAPYPIEKDIPVITYIGKFNTVKGVYELVEAASGIQKNFVLLFVTQESGLRDFQLFVASKGVDFESKVLFLNFVPPWRIPSIIKRSTCVVMPERDFPVVQHTPILAREILATGGCLILSRELYNKMRWLGISEDEQLLTVNPKNISEFRAALETVLSDDRAIEVLKENARKLSEKTERFDQYIDDMIGLYEEVLN